MPPVAAIALWAVWPMNFSFAMPQSVSPARASSSAFFEEDKLRAAGELHAPDDDLTSDIAFSVEPEFRNRGIGTAVLRRLILSARNRKIQHLRMNCHGQNQAMQALARKFKADLRIDHTETVGDIIPRAATPFSVLMEALDDAREFGQAAIDVRRRLRLQSGRKAPLVK